MTRTHFAAAFLLLAASLSVSAGVPSTWLFNAKWDEGLAEVALYEGQLLKYGILRDASVDLITVREYFDQERLVKTEPAQGKSVMPVMKQNLTRRIQTGVYEYVQMASTFNHRGTGGLVKMSLVSSEWCGNSHVLFQKGRIRISNYMDDRGTTDIIITDGKQPIFYEELIPYLRQNLADLTEGRSIQLAIPLLSNNPEYRVVDGHLRARDLLVTVAYGDTTETYEFADDELRSLLSFHNNKGEYLKRRKYIFLDYWNRNRPGDEDLLRK
ncbi:MAG: hypothetical protein KJ626_16205 [Verrucomicrobia bacterium]|nr:hypothetical protein [Verrucomicrobiota bacterium]